jgi:hypothetical protein
VGLLLLNPNQQLRCVAAAGRPRRSLAGSQVRLGEGPSVDAFLQDALVASRDLAGEPRWPNFRPLALAAGIPAWLSAPVRQRHGPIGALDFAPHRPAAVATRGPRGRNGFARLIVATLQLATARQQQALSPALRFSVEHDARIEQARDLIMERERLDEVAAVELLRLQAQIEGSPSEPSPNASFPAPELDLRLPSSPPRWVAGGWHRTAAPPRARARQSR